MASLSPPPSPSPSSPPPPSPSSPTPDPSPPAPPALVPPGVALSPPPPLPPPPTTTNQGSAPEGGSSVSTSFVVGISVGGAVVLLLCAGLFVCWRWKKRQSGEGEFYGAGGPPMPPPPQKGNYYGDQAQNWQYAAAPAANHAVTLQPNLPPPRPPLPSSRYPPSSSVGNSGISGSSCSENPLHVPSQSITLGFSKSNFSFEELSLATNGFSSANLLGQGGFGYVHKGLLPDGKEVAVKQLKSDSRQGEREFHAEIDTISRVHHKHLVSLVGYCLTEDKMLLVYEFVPNNTLEFHLHGQAQPTMEWSTRLKIALGSAKGLAYLHEDCHPKIIHRDIKASNILLDYKFEAKVADFGLARFFSDDNTHVSTRVMGTFGYLAPEYASSGKLTDKSDVFSFGVMLLELISGRRPVDTNHTFMDDSLVDWARPLLTRALEENNYDILADPHLQQNYNKNEMTCMIACAAACVRHSARRRPRMSQIVRALEGAIPLENLNEGMRPGHSSIFGSYGSSDFDSSQYNEEMKRFRKLALSSEEQVTTDNSTATTRADQIPSGPSSEGNQSHEIKIKDNDNTGFR